MHEHDTYSQLYYIRCCCIVAHIIFVLQQKQVAVMMPFRKSSNKTNATCEIYTAAFLLKTRLMHCMYHKKTNVDNTDTKCKNEAVGNNSVAKCDAKNTNTAYVNKIDSSIIHLFDKVLIYLEIIANIQLQVHVRNYNINCVPLLFMIM